MNIRLIAVVVALLLGVGLSSPANAQAGCALTDNACQAAQAAAARPDYNGPLAPTTEPMVCLFVVAYAPTELVLYDGPYRRNPGDERVILTWRVQAGHWSPWARDPSLWARTICIQERLLAGRNTVTLCNGLVVNQGYHSEWTRDQIAYLLQVRSLPASDPASLLGTARSAVYGL